MRNLIASLFLFVAVFFAQRVEAATYTLNHGLCVNATVTASVVVKDCGGIPLTLSALLSPAANDLLQYKSGAWTNRTPAQLKTDLVLVKGDVGLGSVENTALSTWAGSVNIATLGTITTGIWHGTAIADSYVASAATWNAKLGSSAIGSTVEAWDADLDALAALSSTGIVKRTGSNIWGFAVSGTDYAPATSGSAAQLGNGSGGFSAYAGGSCTNQFIRSLSTALAPTCATVQLADLVSSSITINTHSTALGSSVVLAFSDFAGTIAAAQVPVATTSALGGVKVDGSSITITSQVISATTVQTCGGYTPAIDPTNVTGGTVTYSIQQGLYCRTVSPTGIMTWFYARITFSAYTLTGAYLAITLPYKAENQGNYFPSFVPVVENASYGGTILAVLTGNLQVAYINQVSSGANAIPVPYSNLGPTSTITVQGSYRSQ